jgi:hypothetical protein
MINPHTNLCLLEGFSFPLSNIPNTNMAIYRVDNRNKPIILNKKKNDKRKMLKNDELKIGLNCVIACTNYIKSICKYRKPNNRRYCRNENRSD